MKGGISIHAVDIANGRPAISLSVDVYKSTMETMSAIVECARLDEEGKFALQNTKEGEFAAVFRIADYYQALGQNTGGFQDVITFPFIIWEPQRHHHLPLKFSAFGFSLFLTH